MFLISLLDFVSVVIQISLPDLTRLDASCRTVAFFVYFGMFTSVYLSSSIAMNLYMAFLRKSRSQPPGYFRCLYFAIPMTVGFVQVASQEIWAATHGYCQAIDAIPMGTKEYIIYAVFVFLFLPWVFILFNIVISLRVIVWLLIKQRQVNYALEQIKEQLQAGNKLELHRVKEYERQLRISRKANSTAIRVAFYPLAPLAFCIMITIYYAMTYTITASSSFDVPKLVRANEIYWFSYPATTFINFLVFLTDPVMRNVFREVRKSLSARFSKENVFAEIQSPQESETNPSITLHDSSASNRVYQDRSSLPASSYVRSDIRHALPTIEPTNNFIDDLNRMLNGIERRMSICQNTKISEL
ncbi:hypothetical protein GGI12_003850 [Dipsacomyces acuminosporus]|nr:hypothetical protein GGI12_003850 [Dipsacomyces acuminosporus]